MAPRAGGLTDCAAFARTMDHWVRDTLILRELVAVLAAPEWDGQWLFLESSRGGARRHAGLPL